MGPRGNVPPSLWDDPRQRPGADWFRVTMGLPAPGNIWETAVHANNAYALYMHDRLSEAVDAIRLALKGATWMADLLYVASGELEARDFGRRAERPPLLFELPGENERLDGFVDLAEDYAGRVEELLAAERQPTMLTLLPPGSLVEASHSPHGYAVPKIPYYKICLPEPSPEDAHALGPEILHEYMHVVSGELSHWRAPRWFIEGLAEWAACELGDEDEVDALELVPGERPRLSEIEGLFSQPVSVADDSMQYAYAAAFSAVEHLIATHGTGKLRDFLECLRNQSQGRAYKRTFGQSLRAFEREWHERLRDPDTP